LSTGQSKSERQMPIKDKCLKVGDVVKQVSCRINNSRRLGIIVDICKKSYHYFDPERLPLDGDTFIIVAWNNGSCSKQQPFLLEKL